MDRSVTWTFRRGVQTHLPPRTTLPSPKTPVLKRQQLDVTCGLFGVSSCGPLGARTSCGELTKCARASTAYVWCVLRMSYLRDIPPGLIPDATACRSRLASTHEKKQREGEKKKKKKPKLLEIPLILTDKAPRPCPRALKLVCGVLPVCPVDISCLWTCLPRHGPTPRPITSNPDPNFPLLDVCTERFTSS